MMDKSSIIKEIKDLWIKNNCEENIKGIENAIMGGATGSEINELIGMYFAKLKKENSPAYLTAKKNIDYYMDNFISS